LFKSDRKRFLINGAEDEGVNIIVSDFVPLAIIMMRLTGI